MCIVQPHYLDHVGHDTHGGGEGGLDSAIVWIPEVLTFLLLFIVNSISAGT